MVCCVRRQALESRLQELEGLKKEQREALKGAAKEHEALRKELAHEKKEVREIRALFRRR